MTPTEIEELARRVMSVYAKLDDIAASSNTESKKPLTVGTILKAQGGWEAIVVWIRADKGGFYATHKPGIVGDFDNEGEIGPIFHWPDGKATTAFSVFERPAYNEHPADLEMGNYELLVGKDNEDGQ